MDEIKVLAELDHIRKRPGMYIGDTKNPTHLVKEVLDNALDELLNNFADTITINFNEKGNISVTDNGRGFPVHEVILPDGKTEDSVVAAVGKLFSGAKFDDKTYDMSKGTHGVGLSAVNALSDNMSLTIKDRNKKNLYYYYFFNNGILEHKQQGILENINYSTKVEFNVSNKYFETLKIDYDRLQKELFLIAAKFPNANIYINNNKVPHGTMDEYVKWICGIKSETPLFHINYKSVLKEEIDIYFTYEQGISSQIGDVNLGICDGTFLNSFATIFYNTIRDNYSASLTRTEVLSNFKFYISLKIKEPKYDSQNKTRMVKNVSHLLSNIKNNLRLKCNESHIKDRIQEIINLKENKLASKILKPARVRVSTSNPLKDCKKTPGDILYILEGDSAEGTLKQVRNAENEAILPVNGKIVNSIKIGIDKAVNTKLKYMLEAIGVDPSKKNTNYRYDKVKVICDADPDGLHISVLVSIAIWKFAPKLIENRKFSIILPPLYGASKKNIFIPIYNQNEINKYTNNGYSIKRFKGLGEMNAKELDLIIRNPIEYVAEMPKNDKEQLFVYELLTESSLKKKVCQDSRFTLSSLIKLIGVDNV